MANPNQEGFQHAHQGFFNPSPSPPLTETAREQAETRFRTIINFFSSMHDATTSDYHRPKLVGLMFEYAPSSKSKENVLRSFFKAMELPAEGGDIDLSNPGRAQMIQDRLVQYAEYLLHHFLMPMMAGMGQTPQPSPFFRSATMRTTSCGLIGTPNRLAALRGDCLVRDRHRCVITRAFDKVKAKEYSKRRPGPVREGPVRDVDGNPITDRNFAFLEAAHIIPHSLLQIRPGARELSDAQKTTLEILNMFDSDVVHLINRVDIDGPHNAITLTLDMHKNFGLYDIFFTAIDDSPHEYRIESFHREIFDLPVARKLYLNPSIDPPLPRLLALHRAIAHILHLSGAGDYIDNLLTRLRDEDMVESDGSTPLGELVHLRLGQVTTTLGQR